MEKEGNLKQGQIIELLKPIKNFSLNLAPFFAAIPLLNIWTGETGGQALSIVGIIFCLFPLFVHYLAFKGSFGQESQEIKAYFQIKPILYKIIRGYMNMLVLMIIIKSSNQIFGLDFDSNIIGFCIVFIFYFLQTMVFDEVITDPSKSKDEFEVKKQYEAARITIMILVYASFIGVICGMLKPLWGNFQGLRRDVLLVSVVLISAISVVGWVGNYIANKKYR